MKTEADGFRRGGVMRVECKTGAEKAWLAASVSAFVLYHLSEGAYVTDGMFLFGALMVGLSFPLGPIAMCCFAVMASLSGGESVWMWLLDWPTLIFVGYVQWFWLLPEIRRSNEPIALNLTQIAAPVAAARVPDNSPAPTMKETLPAAITPAAQVSFDAASFLPPLEEFDEAGLTALERVLRADDALPAQTTRAPAASIFTPAR